MVNRNIPAHRLTAWVEASTSTAQRKARMRWVIAYCYGASYPTMTKMAAMPVSPELAEQQIAINFNRRRPNGTH
jgi:hypothetical protein